MKLFDIIGNKLKIHVDALALPPFQSIWDSEKDKDLAEKYIKFVVFFYKYDSPYVSGYSPEDRERVLKEDIFKDANYTIPDKVYELGRRYQELQRTPSIRLLEAAEEGVLNGMNIIRLFNFFSNYFFYFISRSKSTFTTFTIT